MAELELVVNGNRQVEVDLTAYTEYTLIIAECKSDDRLATDRTKAREEVRKNARL